MYADYLSEAPEWCILGHCHSATRAPWTNYHVANISLSKLSDEGSSCTDTTTLCINVCVSGYVCVHTCICTNMCDVYRGLY